MISIVVENTIQILFWLVGHSFLSDAAAIVRIYDSAFSKYFIPSKFQRIIIFSFKISRQYKF